MAKRRPLTAKELEIAARAKSIWEAKKKEEGLTQDDANSVLGWSQSAFGQYINGKIPFNLDALIKVAKYLGVPVARIDPDVHDILLSPEKPATPASADDVRAIINDLAGSLPAGDRLEMIAVLVDQLRDDLK